MGVRSRLLERVSCHTIALDPKTPSAAYAPVWENAAQRLRSVFADVRPLGSIALEMARVASGDYDGFVSLGQPGGSSVLDYAAGTLLIPKPAAMSWDWTVGGMRGPRRSSSQVIRRRCDFCARRWTVSRLLNEQCGMVDKSAAFGQQV